MLKQKTSPLKKEGFITRALEISIMIVIALGMLGAVFGFVYFIAWTAIKAAEYTN